MRAEKFKALQKPWFLDVPAPDQTWGEGRRDADISFWDKWAAAEIRCTSPTAFRSATSG
jgi:hypothetical protein